MRWAKPLSELIGQLPLTCPPGAEAIVVSDIVEDARDVTPGCLFVARSGSRFDGRTFIDQARQAGAVAVLVDSRGCEHATIPVIRSNSPSDHAVLMADRLFESPLAALPVFAVTGTNGKTTTATFLHHLFGSQTGLIGSIEIDDSKDVTPSRLTTPPPLELRRIMARMLHHGCKRVVMEASSHGISLGRMNDLDIRCAIFTNLSGDHLDFHGSMKAYAAAKRALFAGLKPPAFSVVNLDDPVAAIMAAASPVRVIGCRMHSDGPAHVKVTHDHTGAVQIEWPDRIIQTRLRMPGAHNAMNLAQAMAALVASGVDSECSSLETLPVPRGRLEPVDVTGCGARIYVDFAHTDQALAHALESLRPLVPSNGKLRVVFGCGGDRDPLKRPRMGAVADRLADVAYVTSDNPRTETPRAIIDDILAGISDEHGVVVEPDRARAIQTAVEDCDEHDLLLIAGKGHECAQLIGDQVIPFDDRRVAREAIKAAGGTVSADV